MDCTISAESARKAKTEMESVVDMLATKMTDMAQRELGAVKKQEEAEMRVKALERFLKEHGFQLS